MASSITLKSGVLKGSRYFQLKCTQKSNGSAENSSTITWELSAVGDDTWYSTGPTKVVINGTTVYSLDRKDWSYGKFPVAQGSTSGTIVIPHNNDGTKTINVKFSTAVYSSTEHEYSDTWTLDSIDRYADITSIEKSNITETSVKMSWESDVTIDLVEYKKNSATSWTSAGNPNAKKGSFTISGLTPNAEQNLTLRFQRKGTTLKTNISMGAFKTYDYPHCTSAPDFVIGDEVTLKFYNPLNRTFSFTIVGNNDTTIYTWPDRTGTSYSGIDGEPVKTNLYNSIQTAKSAKYSVNVTYGSVTKPTQGGTYSVDDSKCAPTFTTFTYRDGNEAITKITKNPQALVKGLSTLFVDITEPNKMVAKNGAKGNYYGVSIGTVSKVWAYDDKNDVHIPVGVISSAGTKRLNVRAYDSRTITTLAYKDITVYDYNKPKINVSASRKNNFENTTTLKISGEYSRLTIGGVDKNNDVHVKYRIREKGGTWPTDYTELTPVPTGGKFDYTITKSLENTKAWEIETKVSDVFGDTKAGYDTADVGIGQAVLLVSSNKRKCYQNGVEMANVDDVPRLKGYTAIPDGTDLNTLVTIGTFRSTSWDHTSTMKNYPDIVDGGFKLIVSGWTGDSDYTTGLRQDVYFSNTHHVRRTLDGGATWGPWRQIAYMDNIVNMAFPVGSVYITSTNQNPANLLGRGTWSLIGKSFYHYTAQNNACFTADENVVNGGTWVTRAGQTVRIRQNVVINASVTDTGLTLGKFNFSSIGITQMPSNVVGSVTYSDGANGGISWNINETTGELTLTDVFDLTPIPTGNTFCIDVSFPMVYTQMIDSVCNQFYWKRTE